MPRGPASFLRQHPRPARGARHPARCFRHASCMWQAAARDVRKTARRMRSPRTLPDILGTQPAFRDARPGEFQGNAQAARTPAVAAALCPRHAACFPTATITIPWNSSMGMERVPSPCTGRWQGQAWQRRLPAWLSRSWCPARPCRCAPPPSRAPLIAINTRIALPAQHVWCPPWRTPPAAHHRRAVTCVGAAAPQTKSPADQGGVSGAGERRPGEGPPFRSDLLQGKGEIQRQALHLSGPISPLPTWMDCEGGR